MIRTLIAGLMLAATFVIAAASAHQSTCCDTAECKLACAGASCCAPTAVHKAALAAAKASAHHVKQAPCCSMPCCIATGCCGDAPGAAKTKV